MNKKEFIERMKSLKNLFGNKSEYVEIDAVIELASELDEPQKVQVPQFVAEFITEQKKLGHTLSYSIDACMSDIVAEWYWENSELFVRVWLDGYEVEKEPKYTVKIKTYLGQYLGRYYINNEELTPRFTTSQLTGKSELPTFTRKELEEAGFGEVFNSPLFEVEAVEE